MDHAADPSELATNEAPFEMANLRPAATGLAYVVFVSQRGGARHGEYTEDLLARIRPLP